MVASFPVGRGPDLPPDGLPESAAVQAEVSRPAAAPESSARLLTDGPTVTPSARSGTHPR
jgi:hypothetical protein